MEHCFIKDTIYNLMILWTQHSANIYIVILTWWLWGEAALLPSGDGLTSEATRSLSLSPSSMSEPLSCIPLLLLGRRRPVTGGERWLTPENVLAVRSLPKFCCASADPMLIPARSESVWCLPILCFLWRLNIPPNDFFSFLALVPGEEWLECLSNTGEWSGERSDGRRSEESTNSSILSCLSTGVESRVGCNSIYC